MLIPSATTAAPARPARPLRATGSATLVWAVTLVIGLAPTSLTTNAETIAAYNAVHGQSLEVSAKATIEEVARDAYSATPGIDSFARSGTNRDWAQLVILFAGWPQTEDSITVIMRWMRQENYTDSWWLRNNPLNNGWGADGGTFLGGNPDLVDAAKDVANALTTYAGYSGIRAAFAAGASSAEIEQAIWDSPWATGHYSNGAHWHSTDVPLVTAPASAWGL